MHADPDSPRFVAWVRSAAPYIHAFGGRTFVIAVGGEVLQGPLANSLVQDLLRCTDRSTPLRWVCPFPERGLPVVAGLRCAGLSCWRWLSRVASGIF